MGYPSVTTTTWLPCLRSDVVANDLVDISVRRSEVLPDPTGGALWLRVDELDPCAKQSVASYGKAVDLKGDHRPVAEELVISIVWAIDMNLCSVVQLESR
jgi:hypothetical protein